MRSVRRLSTVLVGLAALAAACTGNSSGRQAVSGKVTFEGKPLEKGQIEFYPVGKESNQAGALIKDGTYAIAAAQGLAPGTYRVAISFMKGGLTAEEREAGKKPTRAVEQIPAKYNLKTELTAEVEKGGANKFDFHLTK